MFLSIKSNATKILAAILALTLAASPSISCISANETNNVESKVPAVSGVAESKNEGFYKKHPTLSKVLIGGIATAVFGAGAYVLYEKYQINKFSDEQKELLNEIMALPDDQKKIAKNRAAVLSGKRIGSLVDKIAVLSDTEVCLLKQGIVFTAAATAAAAAAADAMEAK